MADDNERALWTIEQHFGEERPAEYYQSQLNLLGRTGYMDLYPDVFTPTPFVPLSSRKGYAEEQEMQDLYGLMGQFTGPESGFIRWLINKKIQDLQYEVGKMRGVTEAHPPAYKPPPVPNWMQQYIQPAETVPAWQARGSKERKVATKQLGTLAPLGAQEELTPQRQAQMAGYLAWQKAGAPTEYSKWSLRDMSDWSRWWEEHRRQSEALFPRQQSLSPRWRVAEQR